MVWPTSDINTGNTDAITDSPASARADLLDLIQKFNQLRNHAPAYMQGVLASVDAPAARTALGTAQSGVNNDITRAQALTQIDQTIAINGVPSAWGSSERALQIGNTANFARGSSSELIVAYNAYLNFGGNYVYNISAHASRYEQLAGVHTWYNAPSGTAGNLITFTARMTLDASGVLSVPAGIATNGIAFPATQVPSANANTLDDYEEGTFTPSIDIGAGATGITYSAQRSGVYTKVGNFVNFVINVTLTNKGATAGAVIITGLPFVPSGSIAFLCASSIGGAATLTGQNISTIPPGVARIELWKPGSGAPANVQNTDITNTSNFLVSGGYTVA
jgi:hypothetical protein